MSSSDIDKNIEDILTKKAAVFINKAIIYLSQHLEEAKSHERFYNISNENIEKILDRSNASITIKNEIRSKIGSPTKQVEEKKTSNTIKSISTRMPSFTEKNSPPKREEDKMPTYNTIKSSTISSDQSNKSIGFLDENQKLKKRINELEDDNRNLKRKVDDLEAVIKDLKKGDKSKNYESKTRFSNDLKRFKSQTIELENRIRYLEQENRRLEDENKESKTKSTLNIQSITRLDAKIKQLERENIALQNKALYYNEQNNEKEKLKHEISELNKIIQKFSIELNNEKSNSQKLRDELEEASNNQILGKLATCITELAKASNNQVFKTESVISMNKYFESKGMAMTSTFNVSIINGLPAITYEIQIPQIAILESVLISKKEISCVFLGVKIDVVSPSTGNLSTIMDTIFNFPFMGGNLTLDIQQNSIECNKVYIILYGCDVSGSYIDFKGKMIL